MQKNPKQSLIKVSILILALLLLLLASAFLYTKTSYYKKLEARKYINCGPIISDDNCDKSIPELNASSLDTNEAAASSTDSLENNSESSTQPKVNTFPKILSLNKSVYNYGDKVEVRGENFYAVENDKVVIIVNSKGDRIHLSTDWNQWHSYISFILPMESCTVLEGESGIPDCKARGGKIVPISKGEYTMFYPDFETGTDSNGVKFSIE